MSKLIEANKVTLRDNVKRIQLTIDEMNFFLKKKHVKKLIKELNKSIKESKGGG